MIDNNLEEWRPVKEYEGLYEVSSLGRVRRKHSRIRKFENMVLKSSLDKGGYLYVKLWRGGKEKAFFIHRLVAFAFPEICGEWFEGAEANHKDENTQNNKAINIEWCGHRYNINYGTRNERASHRQMRPCGQYKNGVLIKTFSSAKYASKETGVNRYNIYLCCSGRYKTAGGYEWRYL